MSEIAIRVKNLSKRYRIGLQEEAHNTLVGAVIGLVRQPVENLRRLRQLSRFDDDTPDTIWALKDVSFEVQRGEAVGIIGHNGAGKTTLLKILSRITYPTSGRAELQGRVSSLLEVGTGFHPELTGRENIFLNGAILGMRKTEIDRKFDEIVGFAGVQKFIDTPVKRYSSGMRVRLAFSVAAHLEPKILLVDEVLAVGDTEFQKKCLGKMERVAGEGRTVLFVSHNLAAVRYLCRRGILLQHGRIVLQSSADEVVDAYLAMSAAAELQHTRRFSEPKEFLAWIESATLLSNNSPTPTMHMGDTLTIEIRWHSREALQTPSVGLMISSIRGENIINANNIYQPSNPLPRAATSGIVRCQLGAVPLMADEYLVSLWFGADSGREHQYIENALRFEVVEQDIWGKGKTPTRKLSSLWWPTAFENLSETQSIQESHQHRIRHQSDGATW